MLSSDTLKHQIESFQPALLWLKKLFTPLSIAFLLYLGWRSQDTLSSIANTANASWLIGSVVCWLALHLIAPLFTTLVFRSAKKTLSYRSAFLIHAGRLPAKYLPGGIWNAVARAGDYHEHGFTGRHVAAYLLIENLVAAAVTLTVGGIVVATLANIPALWFTIALASAASAICGGLAPCLRARLACLPWMANRHLLPADESLPYSAYGYGVACLFAYWMVAAASFICFIQSFPELGISVSLLQTAGIYLFSWGIGFITVFAPQGIGVSEFVSGNLLGTSIGVGGTAALLLGFRLTALLADLLAWLLSNSLDHLE